MSLALLVAGSTRTSQPRAARLRGVDALMPRSTATTRYLACPCGRTVYGSGVLTTRARSAPVISGLARTRSRSFSWLVSTVLIAARMAPRSRTRRVSNLVPRTAIPVTPSARR